MWGQAMKKYLGVAAVLAVTSVPVQASTVNHVMNFSGDICTTANAFNEDGPLRACIGNGDTVALSYGDQPGVDVEWYANAALATENRFNIQNPTGDSFATIPSNLQTGSIILRALGGATVGLQGFDFAVAFLTILGNNGSQYTITDLAGLFTPVSEIVDPTNVSLDRREFDFSALNLTSSVGIEIMIGTDASSFGWGIDNIAYSVTPGGTSGPGTPPAAPIPLPAAGWMMIAGLGALATLRRRRRPARAAQLR